MPTGRFAVRRVPVTGRARGEAGVFIVLFPLFIVCVFAMVQAIQWRHDRQMTVAIANETAAAVALYQVDPTAATRDATTTLTAAGLRAVTVTVTAAGGNQVVSITATAPGILLGTATTVSVTAAAPTEQLTP